jgi:hypothetical protein
MPALHQIAQINVSRMKAPIEDPLMSGFVAQLAAINARADASPGFVWRLQGAGGNATYVRAFDDPLIIVNMSVWESIEDLRAFTYRTAHAAVMRDRARWFERLDTAALALWWVPRGHQPSVEEGVDRLACLRSRGESLLAFSFKKPWPAPVHARAGGDYGGRVFATTTNSENGDAAPGTLFRFQQSERDVWATYHGGRVHEGMLVAVVDEHDGLEVRYHQRDTNGRIRVGRCRTTPTRLEDGRLRLHEDWQWLDGDRSSGAAELDEIRG